MQYVLLFLLAATASARPIYLKIDHTQHGKTFNIDAISAAPDGTYDVRVTMLRYYVSELTIVHDGGQESKASDVYLLVDATKPSRFLLGDFPVETVEGIIFSIGVPKAVNHDDPSVYPPGHPLGHQNPTMHWGWVAGYRFVTFEGLAGRGVVPSTVFQFHALEDELYTTTAVSTAGVLSNDDVEIPIRCEVMDLLIGIDATYGQIVHGSTDEAITVMQNFGSNVFSAVTTSVSNDERNASRYMPSYATIGSYPVPATDRVDLVADELVGSTVTLVSHTGQVIRQTFATSNVLSFDLSSVATGTYTVLAIRKGLVVARSPLCVVR